MNKFPEFSFNEFEKISKYSWSQRLKEELQQSGKHEELGTKPEPFYTLEDMDAKAALAHKQFLSSSVSTWLLDEQLLYNAESDEKIKKDLAAGADGVSLRIRQVLTAEEINTLHKAARSAKFLNFYFDTEQEIPKLLFEGDHSGALRITNKKTWPSNNTLEQLCVLLQGNFTNYRFLSVSSAWTTYDDLATELAMMLALAIEYVNYFTERGIPIAHALKNIEFSFITGKGFLMEISKLRAFRLLWNRVVEAYEIDAAVITTPLHCTTALDLTSSPENAIRLNTEAMASIIGGCNSLTITPFANDQTDFSERISRNIALLLKEESYLDKVIDPLGGAYYIEKTTSMLAEKTWGILRYIENKGGYLKNL